MKHTTTIVKYECDVCGIECVPVTAVRMAYAYFMDQVHAIDMKVSLDVPYSKDEHHICLNCLRQSIKKWISNTEVKEDDF
jgi:hypothetical protein